VIFLNSFIVLIDIYYLFKRSSKLNETLHEMVEEKTHEIVRQNSFLRSYALALDSSSALTKTNIEGIITYANEKFLKDTGYSKDEILGQTHRVIKHPDTNDEMLKKLWETILNKKVWSGILKGIKKDGKEFVSQVTIVPVLDKDGDIIEFVAPRTDITQLIKSKEHIQKLYVTDRLTGYPNREKLILDIEECKKKNIGKLI